MFVSQMMDLISNFKKSELIWKCLEKYEVDINYIFPNLEKNNWTEGLFIIYHGNDANILKAIQNFENDYKIKIYILSDNPNIRGNITDFKMEHVNHKIFIYCSNVNFNRIFDIEPHFIIIDQKIQDYHRMVKLKLGNITYNILHDRHLGVVSSNMITRNKKITPKKIFVPILFLDDSNSKIHKKVIFKRQFLNFLINNQDLENCPISKTRYFFNMEKIMNGPLYPNLEKKKNLLDRFVSFLF